MGFKFVDRENDLDFAHKFLSSKGCFQSVVYEARAASGFSSFLEYVCSTPSSTDIRILANKGEDGDIYLSLIRSIQQSKIGQNQLKKAAASAGIRDGVEILCSMIPYIGPVIEASRQKLEIAGLENRNLPREIVLSYLRASANDKNLILAIDNVHSATEDLKELVYLIKESGLDKIKLLLGHVSRPGGAETFEKFSDRIYNLGLDIIDKDFLNPDEDFIAKYIREMSPNSGMSSAQILKKCNGDIYRIKRMVLSNGRETEFTLSELEKFTLGILNIASQPLRVSDLLTILLDADQVHVNVESEVHDMIEKLVNIDYIKKESISHGDTFLSLRATSEASRVISPVDTLVIADVTYSYFRKFYKNSARHSKTELSGLLYRLSQVVSPDSVGYWSRELINTALGAGTLDIARAQISNSLCIGSPKSKADLITDVTFNFLTKDYGSALELLNKGEYSKWSNDDYLEVLKAVCLNRCREHLSSARLISQLLARGVTENHACILYSFYINGLIHDNKISEAKRVFEEKLKTFSHTRSYPTLLRTASSIYPPEESIPYLVEAKELSIELGDVFGVAALNVNIAVAMMEVGQYEESLKILNGAYDDLLIFGPHHLHIVQNNLGICNIALGNYKDANSLLKKSSRVSSMMPRLYSEINRAMSISISENATEGLSLMLQMRKEIDECPVDRVRQRYFTNLALLSWCCNESSDELGRKIEMACKHKDRKHPERTMIIINHISQTISCEVSISNRIATLKNSWQPCYLEYWYFDPLSSLTDSYIGA